MSFRIPGGSGRASSSLVAITKGIIASFVFALGAQMLAAQQAANTRTPVVSDWTHHHVLYPDTKDESVTRRLQSDPRWTQNWYLRHQETWWPRFHQRFFKPEETHDRDWNTSLGTTTFDPIIDFNFNIAPQVGHGSLNTSDQGSGSYLATAGTLTVTAGSDLGTYPLDPGGPSIVTSPMGAFLYNNVVYLGANPSLDVDGLLFNTTGKEINIWGNSTGNYSFYDYSNGSYGLQLAEAGTVNLDVAPGGGQTYPAKYVFNINATPSCTGDFAVIGIPSNPASGGQANLVGYNNLYSSQGTSTPAAMCGTSGPKVIFAYASGTGEIPASLSMSQNGTQLAYVENLSTGSSYFHVLTIGTTGTNGASATNAVVPGSAGGNNAVDQRVLLSPNGGTTNQSSTNAPYVVYTTNDASDWAYITTYSTVGGNSGYLFKISNVFNGSATPAIVWSVAINAVPSAPIYDSATNQIFFTDSEGRIDYVIDSGSSPSVVYSGVFANGNTAENPVTLDITNGLVYATFNSNGTNALVVQVPTNLTTSVSVPVGAASTNYTGPYGVTFNNAFWTGTGTPMMYVAGTGTTGSLPTLYAVGYFGSGMLNPSNITEAALTTGSADSNAVTEFYNPTLNTDYLFVGVTSNCIATTEGGSAGCVMSLNITSGFPTVSASTTALAAAGGTSGIIVDNDGSATGASSIYYATKTGATLVKATQSGLN